MRGSDQSGWIGKGGQIQEEPLSLGRRSFIQGAAVAALVVSQAASTAFAAVPDPASVARPAIVKITYTFTGTTARGETTTAEVTGSGIIFDPRGYIVTNQHVVEDAQGPVDVTLIDGRTYSGTVVGQDLLTDVAVVKITGQNLPIARFADSSQVVAGQAAIAIGHTPFVRDPTAGRAGTVLGTNGNMVFVDGAVHNDLIRTDISIFPGDSGGALINDDGLVIGMNVIRLPDFQTRRFIEGMHIPGNRALAIAQALMASGRVIRPYFGIVMTTLTPQLAQTYGVPAQSGVLVQDLDPDGPAAQAGIDVGDTIQAVGGQPVVFREDVYVLIDAMRVGQQVRISGVRYDGTPLNVVLTVGERPE